MGRWQTIPLPTLSFAEYLRLRRVEIPDLPPVRSLRQLFNWGAGEFSVAAALGRPLTAHFHEYLLRGRSKIYLADAALPGAVLLLGRKLLEKPERLGAAVETAFFKHLYTRYYPEQPSFSYWQDKKNRDLEVDLIVETGDRLVPFEVKYQDTAITPKKLKGLRLFLEERGVEHGYVVTQRWEDFRVIDTTSARKGKERETLKARILAIPAPLACLWLSL